MFNVLKDAMRSQTRTKKSISAIACCVMIFLVFYSDLNGPAEEIKMRMLSLSEDDSTQQSSSVSDRELLRMRLNKLDAESDEDFIDINPYETESDLAVVTKEVEMATTKQETEEQELLTEVEPELTPQGKESTRLSVDDLKVQVVLDEIERITEKLGDTARGITDLPIDSETRDRKARLELLKKSLPPNLRREMWMRDFPFAKDDFREESNSAMEKIENMRPKIFTFFQRIETTKRDTGMTDSDDDSLLDLWVKAWNEAGFDAKIMDLSDAKQHPRYNEYSQLLKDVPMENNGGINRPYNEMCFYRWLAMASVVSTSPEEIVWMADYDVFPLTTLQHNNQEPLIKPNFGGAFTVYSINVPCLMSGSAPEWERMAFKILQNGIEHHDVESQMWTDMFALMDLGDTNSDVNHEIMPVYHSQNSVISASNVLLGRDWKVEDCTDVVMVPKDTVAVHFSHHAMKTGLGGSAERVGERPTIIRDFISMKKNVCRGLENVKPLHETY